MRERPDCRVFAYVVRGLEVSSSHTTDECLPLSPQHRRLLSVPHSK